MIIQCRQCRTKFRFDESLMQGSGVWLRCSKCGHVYFQENPNAKKPAPDSISVPQPAAAEEEVAVSEKTSRISEETPSVFYRDENGVHSSDKIAEVRKRLKKDAGMDLDMERIQEENINGRVEEIEKPEIEETEIEEPLSKKSSGGVWKTALWSFLVILVIPAAIYFFVFPQYGEQLVNGGQYLIQRINEYRGVSAPASSGTLINHMVKLRDVRYRRINNYILGQIGVVEGVAVNTADYPVARVSIKGEIVDVYSVILGGRTSYAGNILTDEELTNFSEEEILMKLLQPEGLNNSNDRIMPNDKIPFMIVFTNEPSGVIKTTVMTIGAERLL
jgi:predicted Zn finger-like uncharacterized protein